MTEERDSLSGVTVLHTDQPEAEHVAEVTRILNDNNQLHGYQWSSLPLSVVLKDAQGKIVGGLIGSTNWGWWHVDLLSVDRGLRGWGYGT